MNSWNAFQIKILKNTEKRKTFAIIFKFWALSFFRGGSNMITYLGFWYLKCLRPTYICCPKGIPKSLWHLTTEFPWSETMKNNPYYIHAHLMKSSLKKRCTYFLHYSGGFLNKNVVCFNIWTNTAVYCGCEVTAGRWTHCRWPDSNYMAIIVIRSDQIRSEQIIVTR